MKQLPPLGRHFIETAEALANFAMANPVQTADEVAFETTIKDGFTTQAAIFLPDGTRVNGFAKSASQAGAAKHVFISQLATWMGVPVAPYILLRGKTDLAYVNLTEGHERGCTLFSPRVFDYGLDWQGETDLQGKPIQNLNTASSLGLAVIGQFGAWLHNKNFYAKNLLLDLSSDSLCLLDPELSDPTKTGIDKESHAFIMEGWEVANLPANRSETVNQFKYIEGVKEIAARIQDVSLFDLQQLAKANAMAGLPIDNAFVNGLANRCALFDTPVVVTPYAERAYFNMAPRKPHAARYG